MTRVTCWIGDPVAGPAGAAGLAATPPPRRRPAAALAPAAAARYLLRAPRRATPHRALPAASRFALPPPPFAADPERVRFAPMRAFLLRCVGDTTVERVPLPDDTDGLWEVAHPHVIAPTVACRADFDAAPAALRDAAAEVRALTAAANALLVDELHRCATLLHEHGIPTIVLKGGALLISGLVAFEARHLDDIDLLVRPEHADRAVALLRARGYTAESQFERVGVDGRPISASGHAVAHTAAALVSPTGASIDLHKRVPDTDATFDELAAHCSAIDASPVLVPHAAPLIGMLCHHVLVHHQARPYTVPRHMADMRALLAHPATQPDDFTKARRWGGDASVAASLALVAAASGQLAPAVAEATLAHVFPPAWYALAYDRAWNARLAYVRARRDLFGNPALLARKIVPTRAYLEQRYGLQPGAPAWPVVLRRLRTFDWLRGDNT